MWTTQIAFYNVTTHRDLNFNSQKQFWTLHCNIINHGEVSSKKLYLNLRRNRIQLSNSNPGSGGEIVKTSNVAKVQKSYFEFTVIIQWKAKL